MQNFSSSSQTGLLQVRQDDSFSESFLGQLFDGWRFKCYLRPIFQSMKNFGLDHLMRIYLNGLSSEDPQATAEVRRPRSDY